MTIELAVFDLLGTLANDDDAVAHCLRAALVAADVGVTGAELRAVAGLAPRDALRILLTHNRVEPAPWSTGEIDRLHAIFEERYLVRLESRPPSEMLGATPALKRLSQMGLRVAIETELSRPLAKAILDRTGFVARGLVDAVVTSDCVWRGRPFGDAIALAMERTGVGDPENVAKIGDTTADIEQAIAAQCEIVIGIAEDAVHQDRLRAHRCAYVLPTVALVPELLRRIDAHPTLLAAGRR
jgi:phosphonatase-like hydrolase